LATETPSVFEQTADGRGEQRMLNQDSAIEAHPSKEVSLVIVVGNYAIRLREFITVKFA